MKPKITVLIPCYKSKNFIVDVVNRVGPEVQSIIVVDDACPQQSGEYLRANCQDKRLTILYHENNTGVGGAMKTAFKEALKGDGEIFVKIDSDGQIAPELIPRLTYLIANNESDFCKGNRFYDTESLADMPNVRVLGNAGLSFISKFSTGYWDIVDPTNGLIALHRKIIENTKIEKLSNRYFFETDLLFRANILRAKVTDIPMKSVYGSEESGISPLKSVFPFLYLNLKLILKRIFYTYFIRDFNVGSISLIGGIFLSSSGLLYGAIKHLQYSSGGAETPVGFQVITLILFLMGFQLLLNFINYDISSTPRDSIHRGLPSSSDKW